MDEVLEIFEKTFVSETENEPKSNFEDLYKYTAKYDNQEQRRKEILEVQKTNRRNKLDNFRGILELVNAEEEHDLFHRNDRAYYRPNIYVAGFNKTSLTYKNVLMMSEWMIEKPNDFNDNWFVVPCPKGVRMLVVANRGSTKCYTKHGHFRFEVSTALPGGYHHKRSNNCCVLDCFYYEKTNTMYILDLLAWNNQPMTDGETDFRHFWLLSQFAELPGINVLSKKNELNFKILPKVPCSPESFNKFMMTYPAFANNSPPLDGLLFYHKRAHYVAGPTPLVGWLFPYMVPEVLGAHIQIHELFATMPEGYVNQRDFIEKFEAKNNKKANRSRKTSEAMDTGEPNNKEGKKNKKKSKRKGKNRTETMEAEASIENEQKEDVPDDMETTVEKPEPSDNEGNNNNTTQLIKEKKGDLETMETTTEKSGTTREEEKN